MHEIRYLDLGTHNAFENMAIDEAIMLGIKQQDSPPTLRLYRWLPSAVSIGTFQSMRDEVDVKFCEKKGIDYIRRITGGGAVFHDYEGEITYSIILPKGHTLVADDIIESYRVLCAGITSALANLGIHAEFKPINDVVVDGRKVSGNAQTRRHSCVLQHGTVLLNLDVEMMFQVLKVPAEKISDKMVRDVKTRVTSLREVSGRDIEMDELKAALVDGFSEALNLQMVRGRLHREEKAAAERLAREKYATDDWNFSR
jgi:lipoate-protein ligase A